MGTFILSFIGNGFVKGAGASALVARVVPQALRKRRVLVMIYFAGIISLVTLFGVMTIPDMVRKQRMAALRSGACGGIVWGGEGRAVHVRVRGEEARLQRWAALIPSTSCSHPHCTTTPRQVREGADFVERLQNDNIWVVVLKKMRQGVGEGVMSSVERFLMLASSDDIVHMAAEVQVRGWVGRSHGRGVWS